MSPYWGVDFFTFFQVLISRVFSGEIFSPASDEVQIGVLCSIAIACGSLGPFLVLKKMTMFANSLSHTILVGIILAFLCLGGGMLFDLPHLLLGALIAAILTAVLTESCVKWLRLTEDASVGLVFTMLFALGIVLATIYLRDVHLGIESVMGNADALQKSDVKIAFGLGMGSLGVICLFFRQFQTASFDPHFAKSFGLPVSVFHFLLLFLVAVVSVGAFRAIGVLLVLAFLVGPYLTARLFSHHLKRLIAYSIGWGLFASIAGVAVSRHILSEYDLPLSTGGVVACLIGLLYFLCLFLQFLFARTRRSDILRGKFLKASP